MLKRSLLGVFALGALLVGCGTDGSDTPPESSRPPSVVTSTVTATAPPVSSSSVIPAPTESGAEETDESAPYIVGCGTDKNVYNRGTTFYSDGSSSEWTQYCADQFDLVNNPPKPPGMNGGGGAVAGPCDTPGEITYTPDGRKQQCSGGHWVYIA